MISKAQAAQRAGRAGRTAPGKCYRLYTSEDYEGMKNVPDPAIHRADFTSTALQLKGTHYLHSRPIMYLTPDYNHNTFEMLIITAMGIQDICGFGFMDPPKRDRVNHALHRLKNLGALDNNYRITVLGFQVRKKSLWQQAYKP